MNNQEGPPAAATSAVIHSSPPTDSGQTQSSHQPSTKFAASSIKQLSSAVASTAGTPLPSIAEDVHFPDGDIDNIVIIDDEGDDDDFPDGSEVVQMIQETRGSEILTAKPSIRRSLIASPEHTGTVVANPDPFSTPLSKVPGKYPYLR